MSELRPQSDAARAIETAYARHLDANRAACAQMALVELILALDALAQRPEEFTPAYRRALIERATGELRRVFL